MEERSEEQNILRISNFENNKAGEDGGAVSSSPLFVNNSHFADNEAESQGGAIKCELCYKFVLFGRYFYDSR